MTATALDVAVFAWLVAVSAASCADGPGVDHNVTTTDQGVYDAGGLDNEVSATQILLGLKVTGKLSRSDAKAIVKAKTDLSYVDPDPRHNRDSAVTPNFHQVLQGFAGAKK